MKQARGILVFFHCAANNGYSIKMWEKVFWDMAQRLTGGTDNIHFSYASYELGAPKNLPAECKTLNWDPANGSAGSLSAIREYIQTHGIDLAFGFDQPVRQPSYSVMRKAGVRALISYWGAPMSDFYSGWRLWARKIEVLLAMNQPDLYIFQCQAMLDQAVNGRGLRPGSATICNSGVDEKRFAPDPSKRMYAYEQLQIPADRRIVYYSGHFEPRKGVAVIARAAVQLVEKMGRRDVHFVMLGNRGANDADACKEIIRGTAAESHVTFAGYRTDGELLLKSAYLGVIATTGWDSFPVSGMEISSSGVPLIVSKLMGLPEMIEAGKTGETIPPGDHEALAACIAGFLDDPERRDRYGAAARQRTLDRFTTEKVTARLTRATEEIYASR